MALVGYGTEINQMGQSMDYWIVQNSWGTKWAEKGFIKIERGRNLCNIGDRGFYPVLKSLKPISLKPMTAPSFCSHKKDVYSESNVYLKSFCIDKYARSFEDSRIECLKKGMQLFKLDSMEAQNALKTYVDKYREDTNYFVRWYVDGGLMAKCSIVINQESFKVEISDCKRTLLSVCEFINDNRKLK